MPGSDVVRKAIELGRQKGFLTFGELNELLPSTTATPDDIKAILAALSDEGINVVEDQGP
jgi:RNA polymerase primary sigma factor